MSESFNVARALPKMKKPKASEYREVPFKHLTDAELRLTHAFVSQHSSATAQRILFDLDYAAQKRGIKW